MDSVVIKTNYSSDKYHCITANGVNRKTLLRRFETQVIDWRNPQERMLVAVRGVDHYSMTYLNTKTSKKVSMTRSSLIALFATDNAKKVDAIAMATIRQLNKSLCIHDFGGITFEVISHGCFIKTIDYKLIDGKFRINRKVNLNEQPNKQCDSDFVADGYIIEEVSCGTYPDLLSQHFYLTDGTMIKKPNDLSIYCNFFI